MRMADGRSLENQKIVISPKLFGPLRWRFAH